MRPGVFRSEFYDDLHFGVHYAVVCQNNDPDKLERIKVRLPWLANGEQDQTFWAQLATPMEGKKFGWYTLPDVDDVVAVVFVGGDFTQPVVLGGVWSKPDHAPEANEDGKNNFRGYRSRSGHRLLFDDSGKTKVVLADKTGKNVLGVGEFAKDGTGPNTCAVFKPPMAGSKGVAVSTMDGKLELTCASGTLTVTAKQNIKISASTTIDIKAGGELNLEGGSSAKLTSGSPSNYDAPTVNVLT